MSNKPIPAFYCCYVLRSTVSKNAMPYVGSTPNPRRRIGQHNGESKGGAHRTFKNNLRPWEMACIVTGFPSSLAALQFEWAWNKAHITTHISQDERITRVVSKGRKKPDPDTSPANNKPKKGNVRWNMTSRLQNLHLLLRVSAFARWPLSVTFFCEDVYRLWQRCNEGASAGLREGFQITLDDNKNVQKPIEDDLLSKKGQKDASHEPSWTIGPQGLDIGYSRLKRHVGKSNALLSRGEALNCVICSHDLGQTTGATLVCPQRDCKATSHLTCLSSVFLAEEASESVVVPTSGKCPLCRTEITWISLVKELSLRQKGKKEVAKLLKSPKKRKTKDHDLSAPISETNQTGVSLEGEVESEPDDEPLEDDWQPADNDEDDVASLSTVATNTTDNNARLQFRPPAWRLYRVVEDSDGDEVMIL